MHGISHPKMPVVTVQCLDETFQMPACAAHALAPVRGALDCALEEPGAVPLRTRAWCVRAAAEYATACPDPLPAPGLEWSAAHAAFFRRFGLPEALELAHAALYLGADSLMRAAVRHAAALTGRAGTATRVRMLFDAAGGAKIAS